MPDPDELSTHQSLLIAVGEQRSDRAWEVFQARYEPLIRRWCQHWSRRLGPGADGTEELTQAVLVRLFENLPRFVRERYDAGKRFRGWLYAVVRSVASDGLRRRQRRPGDYGVGDTDHDLMIRELPGREPAADELADALERQVEQERLVAEACEAVRSRTDDRTWQAFWLMTVEGRRGPEVADQLGMSLGAVYVASNRVRQRLRDKVSALRARRSSGGGTM